MGELLKVTGVRPMVPVQNRGIVIINGKEAIVIELSVCYETRTEEARNFKKRRYQNLKNDLSIE